MCRVIVGCEFWIGISYFLLKYKTQSAFTCSNLTIETQEQGVKYIQN